MIKNVIKEIKLTPYGLSPKMNLFFMIFFIIVGTVMELQSYTVMINDASSGSFYLGGVFLFCAAMFPGQMLVSLDVSALVQASPYKKRLQTSMLTQITLITNLIVLTLMIVLRIIYCAVMHTDFKSGLISLCMESICGFMIMMFSGVAYKHFIAAIVCLYACMLIGSMSYNFLIAQVFNGMPNISLHPALVVLLCYALIFLGAVLENLIAKLFYKHEISKLAFGSAMKRCV